MGFRKKYDVDIEALYRKGLIKTNAPLSVLLILSWHRDDENELAVKQVHLMQRPDLLLAVTKSPGPFYQQAGGEFLSDVLNFDEEAYIKALSAVKVFEVTGKADFSALADWYLNVDVIPSNV